MVSIQNGVVHDLPQGYAEASEQPIWLDKSGALVAMDWIMKLILGGYGYQLRAGTLSAPLVGDVAITDTAAEYCADPASGMVLIPFYQNITINLGGGTVHEYATKSVATASTSGTAFVPLPLNNIASTTVSTSTARVQAAGNVTVTAELATTTRVHWTTGQPIAMGAYFIPGEWEPLRPPPILGGESLYTQIAATTTGPSYFANLDWVELPQTLIGV